ncbi:MAG: bacteriophage receptor-2C outer rane subunit [Bacteroidetes bacterium]|nr:bacteriophage receptor-2C outer rane subunit [Bacteroidota bacterium]
MSKKETAIRFTLAPKTAYIIISALALLLYANTLKHGFVLDDVAVIERNTIVKEGISGIPKLLSTFYWQGFWESNAGLYRPMSMVMFAVEYQLSPDNPAIHHFMNILLYAIVCCLLYRTFSRLFERTNPLFFLFATLLFVVSPLHTEVVANIKSRDEILALLFFLLCCNYLYFKTEGNKMLAMLLSAFFFFLSLLSKEGAIIFLPLIFLFDYLKEKNIITILRNRLNLIITSVVWLLLHQYVIHSAGSAVIQYTRNDNSLVGASFIEQKATALGIFARYLMKLVYPYQMSYDYSFNQIPVIGLFSPLALLGLFLFGLTVFAGFRYFRKDPFIGIGIAFILLPLFLTGNLFFNIGATMADRFLFVSTIGSSLLICWLVFYLSKTDLLKNFPASRAAYVFIPVLLLFSVKTYTRNADWKDDPTLFASDVKTVPNSARAHYNYATALMNNMYKKTDAEAEAQKEFGLCLSIDPSYYDALINSGSLYSRRKEYAAAIGTYRKALLINSQDHQLYANMGESFYRSQQPDSAIVYLDKAHTLGNRMIGSYNILGTAWFTKKEYDKACKEYEKGLQVDSTSADLYLNYGNALAMSNRDQEAIRAFNRSYKLNPENPQPLYFLALTYNKLGDTLNANMYYDAFKKNKK